MAASLRSLKRQTAVAEAETLVQAAESGDKNGVKALLATGVDVNAPINKGQTALMAAAAKGHADIVKTLLVAGADVNARREDGFTSLCAATFFGNADVVRLLVDEGADVKTKTLLGSTAKSWASSRGFKEIVEILDAAEKNHRAAIIRAAVINASKPTETLANAESKNNIIRMLKLSKKLSAAKPSIVATPIEPGESKPQKGMDEELDESARVEARPESNDVIAAGFFVEEMGAETSAVDDLNETTIATAKPAAAPAPVDSSPELTVEETETKVLAFTAGQQPPTPKASAAAIEVAEVASIPALSGNKPGNDQRRIYTTELEPKVPPFVPTPSKTNAHTWSIVAAMLLVMFTSGFITYLVQQHQPQATINSESLIKDSSLQPEGAASSAIPASLKTKGTSASTGETARRRPQPNEPLKELSENSSNNKRIAAALSSQSKSAASTRNSVASDKIERNAARPDAREALPRIAARVAQPRRTGSRTLSTSKIEAEQRPTIKTSTAVSSPDSVLVEKAPASDASSKYSTTPKKKVINWP